MSIYIGDIPIEPIKPLSECLALLKKHKRFIKIGKNCDNDTVIITESFKIDSKYVTVLCDIMDLKNLTILAQNDLYDVNTNNNVLLKVSWDSTLICNNKISKIIDFFYEEQLIANNNQTSKWLDKSLNIHNPNAIFESLKKYHKDDTLSENIALSVQHKWLRPTLRRYQSDAVRWMLHREFSEDCEDVLNPLYKILKDQDGNVFFYSENLHVITIEKPLVKSLPKGGILADEMGLGKTVEILSLILMNPRKDMSWLKYEDEFSTYNLDESQSSPNQKMAPSYHTQYLLSKLLKTKRGKSLSLDTFRKMVITKLKKIEDEETNDSGLNIQCSCGKVQLNTEMIQCITCDKMQHFKCIYKFDTKATIDDVHICPSCWKFESKVVSGATLIIAPLALSTQWENEIRRHIKRNKIKLYVYKGLKKGWVSPLTLASYDIVLTTYNILQQEFYYISTNEENKNRSSRYSRRYDLLTSPLMFIQWWRICLDEGQMVDSAFTQCSQIAKSLSSDLRWAVTGTPIQKTAEDLYGLIHFLGMEPYNYRDAWSWLLFVPYALGNSKPLLDVLGKIMWRTEKIDVLDQIDIPPQEVKEIWLTLSDTEKFYYKQAHINKSNDFLDKLQKYDGNRTLGSFDIKTMNSILQPLLSLRQDCTQPSVGHNKEILSMNELLKHLITLEKQKVEEALRMTVSDMNGIAGLYLLTEDTQNAKITYEAVLKLAEKYEKNFHIDSLLKIHTLNNLYEVSMMMNSSDNISGDVQSYKNQAIELEVKYISIHYQKAVEAYFEHNKYKKEIDDIYDKFTKPMNQWWNIVLKKLEASNLDQKLVERVQRDVDVGFGFIAQDSQQWDYAGQYNNSLISWWSEITTAHNKIQNIITRINLFDNALNSVDNSSAVDFMNDIKFKCLIQEVANCHLRNDKKDTRKRKKNDKICKLCELRCGVDVLEQALFSMKIKTDERQLNSVRREGSWKPRAEELVMKAILTMAKAKMISSNDVSIIEDGDNCHNLLETYKTEFKNISNIYLKLTDLIAAGDELEICKIRMEFETKDADDDCTAAKMPKLLKGLSYNIESKVDKLNIFRKDEILSQRTKLERDRQIHLQNVERLNTSWNYLNGIKANYKDMKYNNDTCPICMEVLGERWAVFECCHIFCISCTVNLIGQDILTDISTLNTSLPTNNTRLKKVKCSMCRNIQKVSQIRYVSIKGDEDEEHAEDLKVTGNFSSKIHAVVKLILDLRQKDEWVKILIFSQWTIILHYVTKALEKNAITYKLHNSNNPANIDQFKNLQGSITCLLLPLKFGSKGLNLIEATHVILMEPLMNPGEEKQAISRVHRIGQTKKTFVYNFIVKNTIEEEIYKAMKSKWYHCKVNDSLCDIVADEMDSVTENNDQTVDTLSDSCVLHSESTMHESDSIMLEKIQNESGPSTAHVDTRVDITNTSSLNQSDALFDDTIDSEATMPLEGDSTIDNTISNDSDVNLSDHKHLTLRQLADLFLTVNDSFSKDIDDNELNNIL